MIAFHVNPNQGSVLEKNVLYEVVCEQCREEGKIMKYSGETARTGYYIGVEHLNCFRTGENGLFF